MGRSFEKNKPAGSRAAKVTARHRPWLRIRASLLRLCPRCPLFTPPRTPAEWAAYYHLRYAVLRQPWQQPPGSERVPADDEPGTIHALLLAAAPRGARGPGRGHAAAHQRPARARCASWPWRPQAAGPAWAGR